MPVIMPSWIADNRVISKPVGQVVAPGGGAARAEAAPEPSYGITVHQPDPASKWYKGRAAELAAQKAKMFEGV